MQSFKNLKVWEKAHVLTLDVYQSSKPFPREEIYGLTVRCRQRRHLLANIAEGSCRRGDVDFARFLQIAAASASELDYHLLLARDLKLLEEPDYERLSGRTVEVKRMLASLMKTLRAESR
jgi:four helix bundle protein